MVKARKYRCQNHKNQVSKKINSTEEIKVLKTSLMKMTRISQLL